MGIWTHLKPQELTRLKNTPDALPSDGFLWLDASLDEDLAWMPKVETLMRFIESRFPQIRPVKRAGGCARSLGRRRAVGARGCRAVADAARQPERGRVIPGSGPRVGLTHQF